MGKGTIMQAKRPERKRLEILTFVYLEFHLIRFPLLIRSHLHHRGSHHSCCLLVLLQSSLAILGSASSAPSLLFSDAEEEEEEHGKNRKDSSVPPASNSPPPRYLFIGTKSSELVLSPFAKRAPQHNLAHTAGTQLRYCPFRARKSPIQYTVILSW